MTAATGLDRRRFLLAGGTAAALVVAGVGLVGCADDGDGGAEDGLAGLFGEAAPAVAAIGSQALADGVYPDAGAARSALPAAGVERDGDRIVVVDAAAFTAAVQEVLVAELADGRLQPVAGYLFTDTELALAVAVADDG